MEIFKDVILTISEPKFLMSLNCIRRKEFTVGTIVVSQAFYNAYKALMSNHNYIVAIQQIRMIIDNCVYLYAATLFTNQSTFYNAFEEGKELNKLKHKGKALTTSYLLSLMDNKIKEIYKECCDWVHPTNKRIKLLCDSILEPESIYKIGYKGIKYKTEKELFETISNDMNYVMNYLLQLIKVQVELQVEEAGKVTTDEQFKHNLDELFDKLGFDIKIYD